MNLADHIVSTLRGKPMTLPALHAAMNNLVDHNWPEEFFAERIAQLLHIGRIVRNADETYSLPDSAA